MSLIRTRNHTCETPPAPGSGCDAKCKFDGGPASACSADRDPSLVGQHDFLNDCEAKTRSSRSRSDERTKDLLTLARRDSGAVVLNGYLACAVRVIDTPVDDDSRRAADR